MNKFNKLSKIDFRGFNVSITFSLENRSMHKIVVNKQGIYIFAGFSFLIIHNRDGFPNNILLWEDPTL